MHYSLRIMQISGEGSRASAQQAAKNMDEINENVGHSPWMIFRMLT